MHTCRLLSYSAFLLTVVLFNVHHGVAGGERSNIAGLSMARAYVSSARGLDAIGTNPANLALGDKNRTVTFTLVPPFGFNFGSDFLNYEIYNDYFTGVDTGGTERASKFLDERDKDRILSLFPSGIAETHFNINVRWFGMTVHTNNFGSFGLSVSERVAVNFDMPKDYARFILKGLDSLGSMYNFGGTNLTGWSLREYSLSYAYLLPDLEYITNLAAGITLKLVHGYGYVGTDRYQVTFGNEVLYDSTGISGYRVLGNSDFRQIRAGIDQFENSDNEFSPFPAPAGSGFGIDLGISGQVMPGLRAALSIVDIGSITWKLNTKEYTGIGGFAMTNPTSSEQFDSLKDAFKGNEQSIGQFSTSLATAARIGASLQLDETPWVPWLVGRLLLALEYEQGFNNVPGNTTRARLALGMEYRPIEFFPIRTGVSFGGQDRFNWAMGFGFDLQAFTLDFGTENIALLFTPDSYDQLSFGLGMKIKI